ncbi:MAG TPA: DUF402 domain-containing protein [Candidatus Sulfotelmatobacter sp.]|nr:DUF402 domain-containing protein [Candidatus Sulfotelmatobacter sp.]
MCALAQCDWVLEDHEWDVSTLWLIEDGAWHAVWVSFLPDGRHLGWYVNFQEPYRRTATGFLAMDLMLDVIVSPDRKWRWKDQDEFDSVVAAGLYPEATVLAVHREADLVVKRIESGSTPFDRTWPGWRPRADWGVPSLPVGWDLID